MQTRSVHKFDASDSQALHKSILEYNEKPATDDILESNNKSQIQSHLHETTTISQISTTNGQNLTSNKYLELARKYASLQE